MRWLRIRYLIAGLAMLMLPTTPAGAQTTEPAPVAAALVQIDGVIDPGVDDAFTATVAVRSGAVDRTELRLVTTLYTRAADVAALRLAADGQLPPVFGAMSIELGDMPAGTTRLVTTTTTLGDLAFDGADLAGVYPLQFQLFQGADPIGSVLSSLVVLPQTRPAPLLASTVVHVTSQAAPLRGDTPGPSMEALLRPDSSLAVLADEIDDVMADGSAAGVAVAADGRLLGDLARLADGFIRSDASGVDSGARVARRAQAALSAVTRLAGRADTEVLAYPYGPADLVALVRHGLTQEAVNQVRAGRTAVGDRLDEPVTDTILVPPDGLDTATVAALGPVIGEAVLLGEDYLTFAGVQPLEPVRRLQTDGGGEVRLLVPDAELGELLADPEGLGTAAVVQQFLAHTAVRWLAASGTAERAVAVLVDFDDATAGIIAETTRALVDAPWLRPVDLSELADRVEPSAGLVRLAYPLQSAGAELTPGYLATLQRAREALEPLAAMLPEDDPSPAAYAAALQPAASVAYRDPSAAPAGRSRAREVLDRMEELASAVQILPSAPVTLTATTGEVPVTIANTSDVPLDLRVGLSASRFDFPDGATRTVTLPPHSTQRLVFQARARNPGGFAPIRVTLSDPTGTVQLTSQQLSVRSTAIPVVGLVATLGSVLVLAVWTIKQVRRRPGRHERRRKPASAA